MSTKVVNVASFKWTNKQPMDGSRAVRMRTTLVPLVGSV